MRINRRTAILSHDGGEPILAPFQRVRRIRETVFRTMVNDWNPGRLGLPKAVPLWPAGTRVLERREILASRL